MLTGPTTLPLPHRKRPVANAEAAAAAAASAPASSASSAANISVSAAAAAATAPAAAAAAAAAATKRPRTHQHSLSEHLGKVPRHNVREGSGDGARRGTGQGLTVTISLHPTPHSVPVPVLAGPSYKRFEYKVGCSSTKASYGPHGMHSDTASCFLLRDRTTQVELERARVVRPSHWNRVRLDALRDGRALRRGTLPSPAQLEQFCCP